MQSTSFQYCNTVDCVTRRAFACKNVHQLSSKVLSCNKCKKTVSRTNGLLDSSGKWLLRLPSIILSFGVSCFFLFSDNPQKCCKYARRRKNEPYLLRCKVIMGDVKVSMDLFDHSFLHLSYCVISVLCYFVFVNFFCKRVQLGLLVISYVYPDN